MRWLNETQVAYQPPGASPLDSVQTSLHPRASGLCPLSRKSYCRALCRVTSFWPWTALKFFCVQFQLLDFYFPLVHIIWVQIHIYQFVLKKRRRIVSNDLSGFKVSSNALSCPGYLAIGNILNDRITACGLTWVVQMAFNSSRSGWQMHCTYLQAQRKMGLPTLHLSIQPNVQNVMAAVSLLCQMRVFLGCLNIEHLCLYEFVLYFVCVAFYFQGWLWKTFDLRTPEN